MTNVLTIIIPYYNSEKTIGRTLASLAVMQKDPDYSFDVLVVDDGSTNALDEKQLGIFQFPITVIRTVNRGPLSARCLGIELSRSEYVYFLDADDELADTFFVDFCGLIRDGEFDICIVGFCQTPESGALPAVYPDYMGDKEYLFRLVGRGDLGYAVTQVFRKSFYTTEIKAELDDAQLRYSEDLYFWATMFRRGRTYRSLNRPAYIYHPSASSASGRHSLSSITDLVTVYKLRYEIAKKYAADCGYEVDEFLKGMLFGLCYVRKTIVLYVDKGERDACLNAFLSIPFLQSLVFQRQKGLSLENRVLVWMIRRDFRRKRKRESQTKQ